MKSVGANEPGKTSIEYCHVYIFWSDFVFYIYIRNMALINEKNWSDLYCSFYMAPTSNKKKQHT
jgi:hypothetical protein